MVISGDTVKRLEAWRESQCAAILTKPDSDFETAKRFFDAYDKDFGLDMLWNHSTEHDYWAQMLAEGERRGIIEAGRYE